MGYSIELAIAVERLEKDLVTRAPYLMTREGKGINYWLCKDQERTKVVVILPEQDLAEEDMELVCDLLHEHQYRERIVYTNESRYSLGRGVVIKPLP